MAAIVTRDVRHYILTVGRAADGTAVRELRPIQSGTGTLLALGKFEAIKPLPLAQLILDLQTEQDRRYRIAVGG